WRGTAMMNRKGALLTLLVFLLVLAAGCSREVKKEYYPDGKLKSVHNYKKGELEGIAIFYHPNGSLKERANYRKGKRERITTTYYESGKLKGEISYVNGKREGITKLYNENGEIVSESFYKDDKLISENEEVMQQ
ncbi:MAG: toxin-antitoxin system YwqK family antitoxin, partial [Deltaproteobacteria bacterium]|nr:toxin-antitoxin system YwqK family antitoxin [Deltaproteobacteria bacterium]